MRLRRRRYHTGGGIPPHEHPHPDDVLQSIVPDPLVSESTEPSGYTTPRDPFSKPINIIRRPDTLRGISDEEGEKGNEPISWLELFSDPMRAFRFYNQNQQFNAAANIPGYEGRFEPFRRPTKFEFEQTGGSPMDFAGQVFNPATYIQTAVELDKDLTELDRTIIASFEDGRFSPADLDRVAGQLSDAGFKTLMLIGGASMLRGSGVGSLKFPASEVSKGRNIYGRNLGPAADDFIGSTKASNPDLVRRPLTSSTGPLQQLAGSNVPVAASNVPAAASEAGLFGNKLTFQGLKNFFLPKPELGARADIAKGEFSLSNKMTDAMVAGEKFATQYYLNANTLDRLGQLYGPLGTNQLYDLGINKTFDNIASNLKAKDFSYTYPGGSITYSGDQLQNQIKKLYTERALWATGGFQFGSELFPFKLSEMQQGNWGTYANRHFPGILASSVGGFGRTNPISTVIQFTPQEIKDVYYGKPFGVHPDDFKQSLIDTYGAEKGLETYENIGGLRYEANNEAGNLSRTYGLKSFPERVINPISGFRADLSRSMSSLLQEQYDNAVRTVVHEMNHYYFGMVNLPNELIVPWMQYLTDEANFHLFSKYPKGKIKFEGPQSVQYYAQPVEIQARTGELRYELVSKILANKGITLSKETPYSTINTAIDELEIILKRGDEDAFNELFGGENGDVARTIKSGFKNVVKGNNFEEKRRSYYELMKIVPVVGAPLVLGAPLSEGEDLPILGYKDGGALKFLTKKYGAGGTVEEFGAQGNFETEYKSRLPEVEEPSDPNEELLATTDPEVEEPTLTEEEIKALKKKKALGAAGKGAATGAAIGSAIPGIGTVVGAAAGALIGGLGSLLGNKGVEDPALIMARNGIKVHKKQRTFDEGGLFEALRQRRAERRIEKTPVRYAGADEVLKQLASYSDDDKFMLGEYSPENKEIVMYVDDPDILKHEQVHATQYGPLQRLARKMDSEYSARIQDPKKRKSYRKLSGDISPEIYETFNDAGKFILGQGEEFEAVLTTGVNAAKEMGVDFTKSFDEIKAQLEAISSPTNNIRGLMKFMQNPFTEKQKNLILKAL